MNYAEMEAGPEMDRLVAENVMGWHARGFDGKWHDWYDGHEFVIGWSRWHPSACIFQAWQVVEKLALMGEFVGVMWNGQQWECALNKVMRKADTAPLAICRAALMALKLEGK